MSHYNFQKILTYLIFLITANCVSEDIIIIIIMMMTQIYCYCVCKLFQSEFFLLIVLKIRLECLTHASPREGNGNRVDKRGKAL